MSNLTWEKFIMDGVFVHQLESEMNCSRTASTSETKTKQNNGKNKTYYKFNESLKNKGWMLTIAIEK